MRLDVIFNSANWGMPFHFWSAVFFIFGCVVGSFLNVVIHRLPLEESIVSPPSHCPHCKYSIPWYLNIPLVTWLYLGGKCANCGAPISIRYFLVELLTGITFLACWIGFGPYMASIAIVYCIFLAGLIAATFIDFEHYIIPDEITIGGAVVGFLCSLLVPPLHGTHSPGMGLWRSFQGIAVGAGLFYAVLRLGKLFFGKQKMSLPSGSKIIFTETAIVLPEQEILYEELFYRKSDSVRLQAGTAELSDRCYRDVSVRLTPGKLFIGEDELIPEEVPYLEVVTDNVVLPREAMGLGDVKFMAAIGAFLGWQAVIFTLMASSIIGSVIMLTLVALKRHSLSARLPYGPYIAVAAVLWIFGGHGWWNSFWSMR
ncbi:MAG TPA: prepilin peptidase [Verrucomicrobiae bacterium]|jgi:leader peptidase (prepilin peptidase)/N-methyltransferase|nr:prepilin peptidase [Verrucomicrobiae bacterium]